MLTTIRNFFIGVAIWAGIGYGSAVVGSKIHPVTRTELVVFLICAPIMPFVVGAVFLTNGKDGKKCVLGCE